MLLLIPATRFLLDENVRSELDTFLRNHRLDVRRLSKGAPDRSIASTSREEKRVIVTNDQDFATYARGKVFSVVVLRLPQRDVQVLYTAFEKLLSECTEWESRVIFLSATKWTSSPLAVPRDRRRVASSARRSKMLES